jgi:hypothetical protein
MHRQHAYRFDHTESADNVHVCGDRQRADNVHVHGDSGSHSACQDREDVPSQGTNQKSGADITNIIQYAVIQL